MLIGLIGGATTNPDEQARKTDQAMAERHFVSAVQFTIPRVPGGAVTGGLNSDNRRLKLVLGAILLISIVLDPNCPRQLDHARVPSFVTRAVSPTTTM